MPTLAKLQSQHVTELRPLETQSNATECLEFDTRSHLTPADFVEQKLKTVLRRVDLSILKKPRRAGRRTAK